MASEGLSVGVQEQRETEPSYPYDAVVLLCGGTRRLNPKVRRYKEVNMTPHLGLNFESALKVAAAAQAYDEKLAPVIISSGGTMWVMSLLDTSWPNRCPVRDIKFPRRHLLKKMKQQIPVYK